ncbi:MAG: tetratricopeptide repeat protein [Rhizobiales bacterium]|nr:tetratricopeptide repeat protein [Hyphomicrobiales bacterium]
MLRQAVATSLLMLAATGASAAVLDDCKSNRDPAVRLNSCSQVIEAADATSADKAIAYRNRGDARLSAGATDQAIADYSAALGFNPSDAQSLAGRARAYITSNMLDRAVEDFTRAIELTDGQLARARLHIGRGYAWLVKERSDQAVQDFAAAVNLNPKSATAHNHLGLAYRKTGDNQRAIEEYTAAITLNPAYALAYNNRGYVYEALGQRTEAIADFSRALLLDGSLTGASDGLQRLKAGGESPYGELNSALIAKGKDLARTNCSPCHAVDKADTSPNAKAPAFRALSDRYPVLSLREPLSRGIAAPHDVMPNFSLQDEQIDAIIAYINALNR